MFANVTLNVKYYLIGQILCFTDISPIYNSVIFFHPNLVSFCYLFPSQFSFIL